MTGRQKGGDEGVDDVPERQRGRRLSGLDRDRRAAFWNSPFAPRANRAHVPDSDTVSATP